MLMLYIIGVPGAGKSTALAAALRGRACDSATRPFPWQRYGDLIQIGSNRADFPGTDALGMSAQPRVIQWLNETMPARVVAEGDRLGNAKFFAAVQRLGFELTVAYIDTSPDVAAMRREQRGSHQSATWLQGRRTKVEHLATSWVHPEWWIDGNASTEAVAARLAAHPALKV